MLTEQHEIKLKKNLFDQLQIRFFYDSLDRVNNQGKEQFRLLLSSAFTVDYGD